VNCELLMDMVLSKKSTCRIAHMGKIQMEDIEKLLAAMEEFLKK
jgi:aspartate aminotransferase-like enzyme